MRKKLFLIIFSVLTIAMMLVSSLGCLPKRDTSPTLAPSSNNANSGSGSTDSVKDAEQDSKISQLQTRVANLEGMSGQEDYGEYIEDLEQQIAELQATQGDVLREVDIRLAAWEEEQQTVVEEEEEQNSDADASPEDAVEVTLTQPYMTYTIPELIADAEYTQTFLITMSLENTLSISVKDIIIVAMVYPYTSHPYPSIDITLSGGILFNHYSSNMFQSWGPLSLKSGQKKSYQLTAVVVVKNTGTETIPQSTLSVPVQAYCIDYSD